MSYLYVCEQGASIGLADNRFQIKCRDGMVKSIPAEALEVIEVFGKVQITTQCIEECLKRGVNILYYSTNGAYYGRLISTNHVNVQRQRLQAERTKDLDFRIAFSKRLIDAKIRNQIVVMRRYARHGNYNVERSVVEMQNMYKKLENAKSIEQVMGYEGTAAKTYFRELGRMIDPQFAFSGRTRRPPKDPFNSLISLGYSIILNEFYGKIEGKTYVRQWSAEKLKGTDTLQTLEQAFHGTFKGKEVYSVHLMYLIDATSVDVAVKDKVRYLREIEERVRNDAAHDIISVTDKTIEQKTGFKPAKIMQMIRELFNYTGMRVKKEYWDSYDYMNQSIVDRMA